MVLSDSVLEIIASIIEKLKRSGKYGLVCDIDDTLIFTTAIWFEKALLALSNPEQLTGQQMWEKYKVFGFVRTRKNKRIV